MIIHYYETSFQMPKKQKPLWLDRQLICHNSFALYTAISRKVVGKYVHATIPKGNMG